MEGDIEGLSAMACLVHHLLMEIFNALFHPDGLFILTATMIPHYIHHFSNALELVPHLALATGRQLVVIYLGLVRTVNAFLNGRIRLSI